MTDGARGREPLTLHERDKIVRKAMGDLLPDWRGDRDVRFAESVIDATVTALAAAAPVPDAGGGELPSALIEEAIDAEVERHLAALHAAGACVAPDKISDRTRRIVRAQVQDTVAAAVGRGYRAGLAARRPAGVEAGGDGLPEGEACFLCGKPEGLPVSAVGKHDTCAKVYDRGRQDGAASNDDVGDDAWREALDKAFEAVGFDPGDYEDPDAWEGCTYAAAIRALGERAASPPRPAGVDREALRERARRAAGEAVRWRDAKHLPLTDEEDEIAACAADAALDHTLAALAPLLGVTGGA